MQKVAGVASVRVSLNEGLTVLELTPGNTVTLVRLREIIRNNGFPTREARVVAIGTAVSTGNDLALEVAGTRERFPITVSTAEQRQYAGQLRSKSGPWLVTGTIDTKDPQSMTLAVSAVGQP
ncbi:MAG TPA: hypothetical protein VNT81_01175 [Vicinamibacterales bacterium]|nr:hypothetical protein [Vicinamibacterales bacterium]